MPKALEWTCSCGRTRIALAMGSGMRITCYCPDCRAFPKVLGHPEFLDEAGGTDLFQTEPDKLTVLEGAENLACLKLSRKGPLRWYASCCDTPLANTIPTRNIPFASLTVKPLDDPDALGPVQARVFTEHATGPVPRAPRGVPAVMLGFMRRALWARITGRHRTTPFFDAAGTAVAKPRRITEEERAAGYGAPNEA